jgi:amino acid permease
MVPQIETLDPEAGAVFAVPTSEVLSEDCPEATPEISSQGQGQGQNGSSLAGAIFNFTNSIVGAGAIGLGGAIAISGGAISIALILFFGILTKLSLDLVIRLSITTPGAHGSYEDLAQVGLGTWGRLLVMACKLFYSFGCLVAYIIVVKDNFAHGLKHLLYGDNDDMTSSHNMSYLDSILQSEAWTTWVLASTVILPLCLMRDMTPLASLSVVSVFSMVAIVAIIMYMFFAHPEIQQPGGSTYEKWFEIRPGVLER